MSAPPQIRVPLQVERCRNGEKRLVWLSPAHWRALEELARALNVKRPGVKGLLSRRGGALLEALASGKLVVKRADDGAERKFRAGQCSAAVAADRRCPDDWED